MLIPFMPNGIPRPYQLDVFISVLSFSFSSLVQSLLPKNTFDFTTAGDWDCVPAVERLPALHYSVDFIFLSFGIMGFVVEL